MNKRHKIIVTSAILPLALVGIWYAPISIFISYEYYLIGGLVALAYLLSLWSLWEGITKLKAVILMLMPVLFTLGFTGFYYLLPVKWPIPTAILFGLIYYTVLLSENVFNVASIRTIPLYRVASIVAFVFTMVTAFMLFNIMYSFNLIFLWNGVVAFIISFLLSTHLLWSIDMEGLDNRILAYSFVTSLVVGELSLALSFWPLFHPLAAWTLMTAMFVILGISTHLFRERLSRGVAWEYLAWGVAVFSIATFVTSWTG